VYTVYTRNVMVRVVLDTNVLVNAEQGSGSFAKRILDLVRTHQLVAVTTHPVRRENELLTERLVRDEQHKGDVREYLALAIDATPVQVAIELEDAEDIKLLAAAVGGQAQFLITDDDHLLTVGEYQGVRIMRPREFWQWWQASQDDSGKNWATWLSGTLGK